MTTKQLTPSVVQIMQDLNDLELMRLQAENNALRAALREIAFLLRTQPEADSRNIRMNEAVEIAEKALGGEDE